MFIKNGEGKCYITTYVFFSFFIKFIVILYFVTIILLDIMGLAHLFNNSIKLYGPYMCINGFVPYGNLIERRLYLNTWSLADPFEK